MSKQPDPSDDDLRNQMFDTLAQAVTPEQRYPISADQRARLRDRVMRLTTNAPTGTVTFSAADHGWNPRREFIQSKLLRCDKEAGTQELLVRFFPGVRVPAHSHLREEQMIVLEGECHIGDHLLKQGDIHVAPPGSWHPEITSQHGALILLRCEYPLPAG